MKLTSLSLAPPWNEQRGRRVVSTSVSDLRIPPANRKRAIDPSATDGLTAVSRSANDGLAPVGR